MMKIKKRKIIIVIPAGVFPELIALCNHLSHEKDFFDEVHIWANTYDSQKIEKINNLTKRFNFIKIIPISWEKPTHGGWLGIENIGKFMSLCTTDDYYLRIDTDICFIEKDAIKKIINCRLKKENKKYFMIYGNIINNPFTFYKYQQNNILKNHPVYEKKYANASRCSGDSMLKIHRHFKDVIKSNNLKKYYFKDYAFDSKELKIPVNVICWHGKKLRDISSNLITNNEEGVLTNHAAQNLVCGDALFVHLSYACQRTEINNQRKLQEIKKYYLNLSLNNIFI